MVHDDVGLGTELVSSAFVGLVVGSIAFILLKLLFFLLSLFGRTLSNPLPWWSWIIICLLFGLWFWIYSSDVLRKWKRQHMR